MSGGESWVGLVDCGLWIVDCGLWTVDCRPRRPDRDKTRAERERERQSQRETETERDKMNEGSDRLSLVAVFTPRQPDSVLQSEFTSPHPKLMAHIFCKQAIN
jgi:hypothetical protein